MNWIDAVLVLLLGLSVLSGLTAGFARVGIEFIAAILGIFVGFWCYGIAGAYVLDYVSSRQMANLIGFFVIFFGMVILGAIVGRILGKFFKWAGLSWFDRLLGGAFGLVRGFIVAAAIAAVLLAFAPSPPPRSVVESRLLPYVTDVAGVLAAMTPHDLQDAFRDTKDKVEKAWSEQASHQPKGLRRE
ncbi:MAG: CvpA family protein [Acidobacteriia bacterium]|nr:CvpA family protein [Terriglobia bacterium]